MSAEISVDKTILIQAGIFVACYGVLRLLVFGPYLKLLEARHARSTELKSDAERRAADAEKLKEQYETLMLSERRKVQRWVDNERRKVADEERAVIQRARDGSTEMLRNFRLQLTRQTVDARKALLPKVYEFASQLASAILGKKVVVPTKTQPMDRKEATLS